MNIYSCLLFVAGCSSIYAAVLQTADLSHCGAVCAVYCPFGNVLNDQGCPTCRCKLAPDTAILVADPKPELIAKEDTSTCTPVHCRMYCPYGWKVDPITGCEYCDCKDPPQ